MCFLNGHTHCQHVIGLAYMPGYTSGTDWPVLTISFNLFTVAFPWILLSVAFAKRRRWHTQICNFRCLITTCVLQVCMDRELINAVVVRRLDGKCQRQLATALKVQHCWTLKTTVGDCWRQSPTCAGDSRQLKYKHARDCRRLSPSRATVGDCRRLKYKPGFTHISFDSSIAWIEVALAWSAVVRSQSSCYPRIQPIFGVKSDLLRK